MESSPVSPMPYEYGGDKDNKEEKKGKKKPSLRIPLPASEVHTSEPKKHERLLPLFEKKEERAEFGTKEDKKDATELAAGHEMPVRNQQEDATLHEDLEEIHDTLWTEFESTEPAAHEPSADERTAEIIAEKPQTVQETPRVVERQAEITMPVPESRDNPAAETFEDIMQRVDTDGELGGIHGRVAERSEPQHGVWGEDHTVHLNAPAPIERIPESTPQPMEERTHEDAISAAPSAAGMAAEVAATEPDQESERIWEAFDKAVPAQAVPAWHPESQPLSTTEQFNDIMQRANMSEQFVAAASDEPAAETASSVQQQPRTFGSFNTAADNRMPTPDVPPPSPFPVAEQTNVPHATGSEGPQWYPASSRYGMGSALRNAAEAGLVGGTLAGAGAAHAAETGGALAGGAATGAIAGGVAGHMAGERAGRKEAQQEVQQEMAQRDERINVLTNEQRTTTKQVEQLSQANQQLSAEQKAIAEKTAAEKAAVAAAATAEAERLHDTYDTKVVHSEWVDMVVDKHTGRLAEGEGMNEFGAAYRAEQKVESEPPDPLAAALAAAQAAARSSADVTTTYEQEHGQPIAHGYGAALPSGQIGPERELSAGQWQAGSDHRLPAPRSRLAVAANPLLWVGVTVLILAFLAAAFI